MKLEHLQDPAGVHYHQTVRGGECWERPLSCSGLAMAEYDDDDDDRGPLYRGFTVYTSCHFILIV